jgi:GTP cyclohydrolase IB
MTPTPSILIADVQNQADTRGIALDRVGITGLHYPLTIREKSGGQQAITARLDILVGLHGEQRGAHMSSLIEALHRYRERMFSMDDLVQLLREVRAHQDSRGLAFESADLRIRFKYFVAKAAPVSGAISLMAYDCGFDVALNHPGSKSVLVEVPVSTVCPCSLEISDIGAHNQRAHVSVQLWQTLDDKRFLWLEDLIALVETCGSAEMHSVLKRLDEKAVTERMFRTPRFVEDVVREVVVGLHEQIRSVRYEVRCESHESIHAHNAYAETSGIC